MGLPYGDRLPEHSLAKMDAQATVFRKTVPRNIPVTGIARSTAPASRDARKKIQTPRRHRLTSTLPGSFILYVPKIRPPYATWAYSWISPPSRSRRMTLTSASTGSGNGRSGLAWFKAR